MRRIHSRFAAAAVSCVSFSISSFIIGACAADDTDESTVAPTAEVDASVDVFEGGADAALDGDDGVDLDALDRVECAVTPCVTALAARGGAHICALLSDQTVRCWGANTDGQLGSESLASSGKPLAVAGLDKVTQITTTGRDQTGTSCARREDGTVMCWGGNRHGELGLSADLPVVDANPHATPSAVRGLGPARRVDLAGSFACAIAQPDADADADAGGGKMYCWGWNDALQLGRGELPQKHGVAGETALEFRRVRMGAGTLRNGFAVRDNGELLSWGGGLLTSDDGVTRTELDALGRSSPFDADGRPLPIPRLSAVRRLSAGDTFACAASAGSAYCWGRSEVGALGNGSDREEPIPFSVPLATTERVIDVATSNATACARTIDQNVHCWGDNTKGQLGDGTALRQFYPVQVSALKEGDIVQIAAMDAATCALVRNGSVHCWGSNVDGQLGIGHTDDQPHYVAEPVVF